MRRVVGGVLVALAAGIWLAMPPGAIAQVISAEANVGPTSEAPAFAGMTLAPASATRKPKGRFIQPAHGLDFSNLKQVIRDSRAQIAAQDAQNDVKDAPSNPPELARPAIAERPARVVLQNSQDSIPVLRLSPHPQGASARVASPAGSALDTFGVDNSPSQTPSQNQPSQSSAFVTEADTKNTIIQGMPRYTGGARPIQAMTTDNQGHPVLISPKNEPIPEFGVTNARQDGGYNALFQAEPDDRQSVNQYMSDALGAYRAKAYPLALKQVQKALLLDANNPDLLAALAEIQLKLGQASGAEQSYQKAQALSPEKYGMRYAQLLILNGNRPAAISVLEALYRQNPRQPQVAYLLGTSYEDLGQTSMALQYLQQAAQLHPASADIQFNLGLAYELSGDRLQAEKHYRQALSLHPSAPEVSKALARVRHSGGV